MKIFSCMCCGVLLNLVFGIGVKDKDEIRLVLINAEAPLEEILYAIQSREEPVSPEERAIIKQKFIEAKAQISASMYQNNADPEDAISPDGEMKKKD